MRHSSLALAIQAAVTRPLSERDRLRSVTLDRFTPSDNGAGRAKSGAYVINYGDESDSSAYGGVPLGAFG